MLLPYRLPQLSRSLIRNIVLAAVVLILVFIGVQQWSQKKVYDDVYAPTRVPRILQPLYAYGTGGFACDTIIEVRVEFNFSRCIGTVRLRDCRTYPNRQGALTSTAWPAVRRHLPSEAPFTTLGPYIMFLFL